MVLNCVVLTLTASDCYSGEIVSFHGSDSCLSGTCVCVHWIAGQLTQFKPCRIVTECFRGPDFDTDWQFVLWGAVFGFKVINASCVCSYQPKY